MLLNEKTAFYKVCFDSMQMGILVFNAKKKIVLVNNPLLKIFGLKKEELLDRSIDDLLKNKLIINSFIENPQKIDFQSATEVIGVYKGGREIFLEMNFGRMIYEGEIYYKAFVSNISKRKQKEVEISDLNIHLEEEVRIQNKELEKAVEKLKISLSKEKELNNLKTKFIELASHEFKTPLSAILTSTELMAKYAELNNFEKQQEHLEKVKLMVNHLNRILDDLLTLENIENGFIISKFKYLNINDLVQGIIQNLKYLLNKNQTLLFENNCDQIIYHEPKIISIILTNLLSNAIKYSAENGRITVKINCDKFNIYFSIEDNGIGIPKNEKKLIFNRFFRAKNALYLPGTGIGLNIVKGYIKSLKGSISFESKEHKGTIFKVQLPKITNYEKDSFIN
jgi:PAS domain S-box-containing protein